MTGVGLKWVKTSVDELRDMEDSFLYALVRSGRLLYIGMSYHTDVAVEVKQNMASFSISPRNLDVYLAYIVGSNVGRLTRQLVHDVEALLIFENQPEFNSHHKDDYNGRGELGVANRGCRYLRRVSIAE